MSFDGLFLGRIDIQDYFDRVKNRNMEMIWHANENADLFTSVLYYLYIPPPGFCFDILCDDDLIVDDIHSPEYNLDKKVTAEPKTDVFANEKLTKDSFKMKCQYIFS